MRHAVIASVLLLSQTLAGGAFGASSGTTEGVPRAVTVARATTIPDCTVFVDAAANDGGTGTVENPHKTLSAAIGVAEMGAVICVAEGRYPEAIAPGEKYFTLAGGFKSGANFEVRDSAAYVSKAEGNGGSFVRIEDPGPKEGQLTGIDGFEISGYSQAIYRDAWYPQRFDITNNFIHDNVCADLTLAGGGFALNNVSGTIKDNVFADNSCGRGGAGFINDTTNQNSVSIENNLIEGNAGTEPDSAHGGALYLFANTLTIIGNAFTNNSVTQWGAGLYVGAYAPGNQPTTATLAWNVYRGNRAGDGGGGFFCDDGATCFSDHEVYYGNCGGNILVDGGAGGSGPTVAGFDHLTNFGALKPGCESPGAGVFIDTYEGLAADAYTITNAIFWGNAPQGDIVTACGSGCAAITMGVTSSLVQTDYVDGSIAIEFGEGNITPADPRFVDADAGDFRLQPDSPLAGTELGAYGGIAAEAQPAPSLATEVPDEPAVVEEPATAAPEPLAGAPAVEASASAETGVAAAQAPEISAIEAFALSKELGTIAAWQAFLAHYPTGFHADLARAYLKELGADDAAVRAPPAEGAPPAVDNGEASLAGPAAPAVARGGDYMGFPERFNRYYTDSAWTPSKTLYASPEGGGDGTTPDAPMSAPEAIAAASGGTRVQFNRGSYQACFEFSKENSGSYDDPIVLYGERNPDQSIGVSITCCSDRRKACFNFENADYIARRFRTHRRELWRARGDYPASQHSRGIAVLNSDGHDQERDPFFTGQSDWAVLEGNVAHGAKEGDGHGIYLSNGSDWNIARFNETYSNVSSDFQINADPASTCAEVGIPFDDPRCDAYAGEGEGGQGASDYFLVDSNYFHHGAENGSGPNFTSVRRSVIRNNIFGPQPRHNVSFWQETDNPKLGSADNRILHNLFITNERAAVQFINNSTRNEFANNVILGMQVRGGKATANLSSTLMEVDETVGENVYRSNLYVSGTIVGRTPTAEETASEEFSATWFTNFPTVLNHDPNDFTPSADAPFLGMGTFAPDAPFDRNGVQRSEKVDLGPIEEP